MCPPAAKPLADIGHDWSDLKVIQCLEHIMFANSLPGNVLIENPYCRRPENLPGKS